MMWEEGAVGGRREQWGGRREQWGGEEGAVGGGR